MRGHVLDSIGPTWSDRAVHHTVTKKKMNSSAPPSSTAARGQARPQHWRTVPSPQKRIGRCLLLDLDLSHRQEVKLNSSCNRYPWAEAPPEKLNSRHFAGNLCRTLTPTNSPRASLPLKRNPRTRKLTRSNLEFNPFEINPAETTNLTSLYTTLLEP